MIQKHNNPASSSDNQPSTAIYGLRPVMEAIDGGTRVDRILLQNGLTGNLVADLKARIRDKGIPYQFVPVEKLNRLARGNHQGVVALISPIEFHSALSLIPAMMEGDKAPLVLMLDRITDVRNFGAIVRTVECAGADAVKTSSGALLRVPVCRESNLKTVVNLARQCGMQIVAATEKGASDYLDVDFRKPTLLIMGAEETGISPDLLKLSDLRAKLPIMGQVQSLNVSVAAAVFMYEALRQRR